MGTIYQSIIILSLLTLVGFSLFSLFSKKGITTFLYGFFNITFWMAILFFILNISMEILTDNGSVNTSETTILNTNHYSKGYNIPVDINLSFYNKKVYKTKNASFSRFTDKSENFNNDEFNKNAGFTKKELDSIFKFSPDVKTIGKKLQIGRGFEKNNILSTKTSSFQTVGFVNIKSENWFFTLCQVFRNYLSILLFILIFYQLKTLFKLLKKDISFSLKLTNKIKWIGFLLITYQLIQLILSFIFSKYYDYIGFENANSNDNIQLNITPRLEFDYIMVIIGLSLFVLSALLNKGNYIQQENDLTI